MKAFLAILFIASISLVSYFAFLNRPKWLCNSDCGEGETQAQASIHESTYQMDDGDSEKTNVSHLLFGIGGSAKTWNKRHNFSDLWWEPNITRGFVWLEEKPAENTPWPETSPMYRVSQDTSKFKYNCWYGSLSAVRMARIVKESFELGLENVRWFVLGDDDTVFFIENLLTVLSKYDHNQLYYIGGNSESVEQDVIHSYTTGYGGGGFAISYPLAAELVRILDGCIDRYASFYGSDQKIGGCMAEIGVPLTKELGFHQVDIRGDAYGLLAAHPMTPLLSLHHLDYVQPLFPSMTRIDSVKKIVEAYQMDPGRTLQHSFCYDPNKNWSVSVSWGYTVQLYPWLETALTLATPLRTFVTWRSWKREPFTFNTREVDRDPCNRPILFFFDRVEELGRSGTLTRYKRAAKEQCNRTDYMLAFNTFKYFDVSAQFLGPTVWTKGGLRRQCCETVNNVAYKMDDVARMKIRGCNRGESVTPPT